MNNDPKSIKWHGEQGSRFAFVEEYGMSYTIREDNGYDIYIKIDGMDVHMSWQPVVSAALCYIKMHVDERMKTGSDRLDALLQD